jgi:hypothetical protein
MTADDKRLAYAELFYRLHSQEGQSIRAIAAEYGVSRTTVWRYVRYHVALLAAEAGNVTIDERRAVDIDAANRFLAVAVKLAEDEQANSFVRLGAVNAGVKALLARAALQGTIQRPDGGRKPGGLG